VWAARFPLFCLYTKRAAAKHFSICCNFQKVLKTWIFLN
jgi:hypothetical protein